MNIVCCLFIKLTKLINCSSSLYQGPTFVFHGLVKCTHALINGRIFYITFTAKAEDDLSDTPALTTFQAEVCCARDKQPEIRECAIKI